MDVRADAVVWARVRQGSAADSRMESLRRLESRVRSLRREKLASAHFEGGRWDATCRLRLRTKVRPVESFAFGANFGSGRRLADRSAGCAIDSSEAVNELGNQNVWRATHSRVPVPCDPQGPQGQVRRRVSQADGCGHTLEWRLRTRKADGRRLRCESNG
jgi:hypothetical protein